MSKSIPRCNTRFLERCLVWSLTPAANSLVLGQTGSKIILGDIISDDETLRFITQDPRGRNAIKYPHGLWPGNTVPYIIDRAIGKMICIKKLSSEMGVGQKKQNCAIILLSSRTSVVNRMPPQVILWLVPDSEITE